MNARSYEKFRQKGVSRIEFPIASRFYLQRIVEEFEKPSSVAYMLMEANRNEYGWDHVLTLVSQVKGQKRAVVNRMIEATFPGFDSMLKIIVTLDAAAI